jgi:hypothetical protein
MASDGTAEIRELGPGETLLAHHAPVDDLVTARGL